MSEFKVQFEIFEGPLDLLLYLVKKEEVDIYEVNLTKLATEFIAYVDLMRELDLDIAGGEHPAARIEGVPDDAFVAMYVGNHGTYSSLGTVLRAAAMFFAKHLLKENDVGFEGSLVAGRIVTSADCQNVICRRQNRTACHPEHESHRQDK